MSMMLWLLTVATAISIMPIDPDAVCARNLGPWEVKKECRDYYRQQSSPPIRFCDVYDQTNKVCSRCLDGFALINSKCVLDGSLDADDRSVSKIKPAIEEPFVQQRDEILFSRNPFCSSHKENSQICLACYDGYVLKDGDCEPDFSGWEGQRADYIKPSVAYDRLTMCKNFTSNGVCTACYDGAQLMDGNCEMIRQPQRDCHLRSMCWPVLTPCVRYSSSGVCK